MTVEAAPPDLGAVIDTIEGGYEFLLAYAAQGRHTDAGLGAGQGPRDVLEAMAAAMAVLPTLARERAQSIDASRFDACAAYFDALERDAAVSIAAVRLALGARDLSSQLADSLNASIHLRALLTDIFLIDEALKG